MDTKKCSRCKTVKAFDEFRKQVDRTDGRQGVCKACKSIKTTTEYLERQTRKAMVLELGVKTCSKCGDTKQLDEFHRHKAECKQCSKQYQDDRREHRLALSRAYAPIAKQKNRVRYLAKKDEILEKCRTYYAANKEGISEHEKRRRVTNGDEIRAKDRDRYNKNPGPKNESGKRWKKNNKEQNVKINAEYYKNNKDRISKQAKEYRDKPEVAAAILAYRERNSESIKAGHKRWAQANKVKRVAYQNKREAAKKQRTVAWSDDEKILAIYAQAQQLRLDTGIKYHVDHIIPLQGKLVSGLHVHNNLRAITGRQNNQKYNFFDPSTWIEPLPKTGNEPYK